MRILPLIFFVLYILYTSLEGFGDFVGYQDLRIQEIMDMNFQEWNKRREFKPF